MREINIKLFRFSELNEEAQKNALIWARNNIGDIDGRVYLVEYDGASKTITQCRMTSVNRRDVKPSNTRLKALSEICASYTKKSPYYGNNG